MAPNSRPVYRVDMRRGGALVLALIAGTYAWTMSPAPTAAQEAQHVLGSAAPGRLLLVAPLALLPSALGPEVAFDSAGSRDPRFVLAWPFQLPVPLSDGRMARHRVLLAVELALGTANSTLWRGRAGYRYAGSILMVGAGSGVDGAAWFLSPEIGLRLPRGNLKPGFHPYATLVLRTDVPFASPTRSRVSLMVGWMIF